MSERPKQGISLKRTTPEEINKHIKMLLDLNRKYKQARLETVSKEEGVKSKSNI